MRGLNQTEIQMVAGGSLWDDFLHFFSTDWGPTGPAMTSVTITGQRMSDVEKFAFDVQQIRNALPDCQVTYVINPTVTAGTVSGTASVTPSATGSATVTTSTVTTTYTCPPVSKSGIPMQPSY